jgi:hypothetical protein
MLTGRCIAFGLLAMNGLIAAMVVVMIPILVATQLNGIFQGLRSHELSFLTSSLLSTRLRFARATRLANLATVCAVRRTSRSPAPAPSATDELEEVCRSFLCLLRSFCLLIYSFVCFYSFVSENSRKLAAHDRYGAIATVAELPPVPRRWLSLTVARWLCPRLSELRAEVAERSTYAAIERVDLSVEAVKHPTAPGSALIAPGALSHLDDAVVGDLSEFLPCSWCRSAKRAETWATKKDDPPPPPRDAADGAADGAAAPAVRRRKGRGGGK